MWATRVPVAATAAGKPWQKQEDQIITVGLEKTTGVKFIYVPFKGGGEVAVQPVGGHIDSTVNNPIGAVAQWRAGKVCPLCVFDDTRMPHKEKVTNKESWADIPTCKEAGVPTDYLMLRGVFMAPGVTAEQTAFYVDLLHKERATPEGPHGERGLQHHLHERRGLHQVAQER